MIDDDHVRRRSKIMKGLLAFCLVLAAVLITLTAAAATHIVRPDGTGDYPTIQAAIHASQDGDSIVLTDGTFVGSGNRDITYLGKAITVRSESGDPETCIIDCEGTEDERHRGFLFQSGEEPESRLESVRITNGTGWLGGAVRCEDGSSPTFDNCDFVLNSGGQGGAVDIWDSAPTFSGCSFRENSTPHDGGAAHGRLSHPVFMDCSFTGNSAENEGGAMAFRTQDTAVLHRCTFDSNTAASFGGLWFYGESAELVDCSFTNNTAERGGGMGVVGSEASLTGCSFIGNMATEGEGGGLLGEQGSLVIAVECLFEGNSAENDDGGGAWLSTTYWDTMLQDCEFTGNRARKGGGLGVSNALGTVSGCVFSANTAHVGGGGGVRRLAGSVDFLDSWFINNTCVRYGGGMDMFGGYSDVERCVFAGNHAAEMGGGLCCQQDAEVSLSHCTFYANSSQWEIGGGIRLLTESQIEIDNTIIAFSTIGDAINCYPGTSATLTCCDLYGNVGGDWVDCAADQYGIRGNIAEDPLFCGPQEEDFTIRSDSPCAPEFNPECGLIGALPVGCDPPTGVEVVSWGRVKVGFR
jgi:hypothetical protein